MQEVERELETLAKKLKEKGFKCTEYHIFPFDTKVISVVFGNDKISFAISLEDIELINNDIYAGTIRIYSWDGKSDLLPALKSEGSDSR